jgi:ankyrin repeat protein
VQADGWTPLLEASWNGHVDAVRALIGAGAAVNHVAVSVYGRAEERGVFVYGVRCICVRCEVCEGRDRGVFSSAG